MEYRRLGASGLQLSALSFGAWITFGTQLDAEAAEACMCTAYDAGVNFFDNAEGYNNGVAEELMGKILTKTGWRRDSYCVSSKVYFGSFPGERRPTQRGLSRKHTMEACEQAMARLQVDYLDLYYCHRPDSETPIEESVRAMHSLIQQGKVLYWGTSEWSAQQIMEAYSVARQYNLTPPTMEQPQYNMFHRDRVEKEYARLYSEIGLGTTIWSPLASGILTGKYADGVPQNSRAEQPGNEWMEGHFKGDEASRRIGVARELGAVADDLGVPLTQLALAWCLKNPHVSTVILGASRVSQIADNLNAINVLGQLDEAVMTRIEKMLTL